MAGSRSDDGSLHGFALAPGASLIESSRSALFETRPAAVAQLASAANLEELVNILRADRPAHLHRAVAEAMTINETSFFRDMRPFEALRNHTLRRLIAENRGRRRLTIWCAACSTGQEVYSMAMLLREHFPELATWDVRILGTDISCGVVDYARLGRYRWLEVNRGLPARKLAKYFTRHGDEWEVNPSLRALCEFHTVNLCAPLPALPQFDLVLLRNVLLYLPQQERSSVFAEVHRQMSPAGRLLLGNAEQAEDSTDLFQAEFVADCYFYRPVPAG